MNDEREVKDDVAAAAKFAIDAAILVAMVAGVVRHDGWGSVERIGVAAAGALGARDKADRLGAARGAAVSGDTELVTKAAVTAAEAEAEQKVIELGLVVSHQCVGYGRGGGSRKD